jgi:hypothetical protein
MWTTQGYIYGQETSHLHISNIEQSRQDDENGKNQSSALSACAKSIALLARTPPCASSSFEQDKYHVNTWQAWRAFTLSHAISIGSNSGKVAGNTGITGMWLRMGSQLK